MEDSESAASDAQTEVGPGAHGLRHDGVPSGVDPALAALAAELEKVLASPALTVTQVRHHSILAQMILYVPVIQAGAAAVLEATMERHPTVASIQVMNTLLVVKVRVLI